MLLRLIAGVGLFAFGYYLGREVGRMQPIREELARARARTGASAPEAGEPADEDNAAH